MLSASVSGGTQQTRPSQIGQNGSAAAADAHFADFIYFKIKLNQTSSFLTKNKQIQFDNFKRSGCTIVTKL